MKVLCGERGFLRGETNHSEQCGSLIECGESVAEQNVGRCVRCLSVAITGRRPVEGPALGDGFGFERSMDYDAIANSYHQHGFEVVKGLFSSGELEKIRQDVQQYLAEQIAESEPGEVYYEETKSGTPQVRCVFQMQQRSDYFRQLRGDSRLVGIVRALFGGLEVVQDGVMLIDKAPQTAYEFPFHQDNAYQFWSPPDAVAATLALDDSTSDSGAIVCLRGSHVTGILPHQKSWVLGASLGLVEKPDTSRYPEVTLTLNPGDLALHHVNVVHRTGPNHTDRHRRQLGFAYHSARAVPDQAARDRYQHHLEQVNAPTGG